MPDYLRTAESSFLFKNSVFQLFFFESRLLKTQLEQRRPKLCRKEVNKQEVDNNMQDNYIQNSSITIDWKQELLRVVLLGRLGQQKKFFNNFVWGPG